MIRFRGFGSLVLLLVFVAACTQAPPPSSPDRFSLELTPSVLSLAPGAEASVTVTLLRAGTAGDVLLSVRNLPEGVQVFLEDPFGGNEGRITFAPDEGMAAGSFDLVVVAEDERGRSLDEAALELRVRAEDADVPPADARIAGRVTTPNTDIPLVAQQAAATGNGVTPGVLAATSAERGSERAAFAPGQVLVQLRDDAVVALAGEARVSAVAAHESLSVSLQGEHGLSLLQAGWGQTPDVLHTNGRDPREVAAELERDPRVLFAEPNYLVDLLELPNDPQLAQQWNLPGAGVPVAWSARTNGDGVVVAVVDSGIDLDHRDLQGRFVSGGYDFCAVFVNGACSVEDADPRPDSAGDFHGTHVTGIIAAAGNNGRGVAGVAYAGARILPVKAFASDNQQTTVNAIARAIRWAAGESLSGVPTNAFPADVINLSLGSPADSQTLRAAVQVARDRGALLIAASGNDGSEGVRYPARYQDVIGVGSVNTQFVRSCFSNYGSGLDLVAPAGDGRFPIAGCGDRDNESVLSTLPNDAFGFATGTSMAAPLVAGIAALVWTEFPNLTAAAVRDRLTASAYFDGQYMSASRYGAGVVRADRALGFAGPGDDVTVTLTGPTTRTERVRLRLDGTSTSFGFEDLPDGSYTVTASAAGSRFDMTGSQSASLAPGRQQRDVRVRIAP